MCRKKSTLRAGYETKSTHWAFLGIHTPMEVGAWIWTPLEPSACACSVFHAFFFSARWCSFLINTCMRAVSTSTVYSLRSGEVCFRRLQYVHPPARRCSARRSSSLSRHKVPPCTTRMPNLPRRQFLSMFQRIQSGPEKIYEVVDWAIMADSTLSGNTLL